MASESDRPFFSTHFPLLDQPVERQLVIGFDCEGVNLSRHGDLCTMQDPQFWKHRPISEMMICSAAADVHFLLHIYHKMMEKLNEDSLWHLAIRGSVPRIARSDLAEKDLLSALMDPQLPGKSALQAPRRRSSAIDVCMEATP